MVIVSAVNRMKRKWLWMGLLILLIGEVAGLAIFAGRETAFQQDSVLINEAVQSVKQDWNAMQTHHHVTGLRYVVLDACGAVVFQTEAGLTESVNAAIMHRDTILDLEVDGVIVGKIIFYNDEAERLEQQKHTVIVVVSIAILVQLVFGLMDLLYLRHVIILPFQKLKQFAQRVAGGNLEVPLEMDRENLFGAFTESFDLMRTELKKARLAEAAANAAKKELVAQLSHDIKTPIASILAVSEVGATISSDEKTKENYLQIMQKAEQINTLITNLFTATLEDLQKLPVVPVDMNSQELHAMLVRADYLHRATLPDIPPCLIYADGLRLQQVLDNLFANSYKYANTEIQVAVKLDSSWLRIEIEDRGGGVDPVELPILKEKFQRGKNAIGIEGAGLGLAIAESFMKGMQGGLAIQNGTTGLLAIVSIRLSGTN